MPYIPLEEHLPGITGLLDYSKNTAASIQELTHIFLPGLSTLTKSERELIGAYASSQNGCFYCQNLHGALAQHYIQCDPQLIDDIKIIFD